ncbi:hypothetical protein C8Q69DRAFT_77033 [Paecilomyces variotii]|uniref:Uncharacterized protein n=1 Tax=Byssochlamys spectabilis TaxID=264951 RepID=A0A443HME2_BYSSP|nr:hypothetical protein C8Q69DRAFT_77033 [Paecilomyces variotii]RWQ92977.1 hypothetical protein C8Q69DRAFT_77033 [Paecilomyces variotii]
MRTTSSGLEECLIAIIEVDSRSFIGLFGSFAGYIIYERILDFVSRNFTWVKHACFFPNCINHNSHISSSFFLVFCPCHFLHKILDIHSWIIFFPFLSDFFLFGLHRIHPRSIQSARFGIGIGLFIPSHLYAFLFSAT